MKGKCNYVESKVLSGCHRTDEKVILIDVAAYITERAVDLTSVYADIAVENNSRYFQHFIIILNYSIEKLQNR